MNTAELDGQGVSLYGDTDDEATAYRAAFDARQRARAAASGGAAPNEDGCAAPADAPRVVRR